MLFSKRITVNEIAFKSFQWNSFERIGKKLQEAQASCYRLIGFTYLPQHLPLLYLGLSSLCVAGHLPQKPNETTEKNGPLSVTDISDSRTFYIKQTRILLTP
jgi:hypothetical protein